MADPITWEGLSGLASFRARNGAAISMYLDLDPHVSPTPGDVAQRAHAVIDEVARQAEAAQSDLTHDQRVALQADIDTIRSYVETGFDRNGAHGLVLFSARLDDLWQPLK